MKKKNAKQTSPPVASIAARLLKTSKNPDVKKVAGSDLSQAKPVPKKKQKGK